MTASLAAQAAGGTNVVVPMRAHAHDLQAMAAAVTPRTRFVFAHCGMSRRVNVPFYHQMVERLLGSAEEALAAFRKSWDTGLRAASIGHAFARAGNRRAAENILGDRQQPVDGHALDPRH